MTIPNYWALSVSLFVTCPDRRDQVTEHRVMRMRSRSRSMPLAEVQPGSVQAYRDGIADFAGYVIAHGNRYAGCESAYSFDRRLQHLQDVLEP